MDAFVAGIGADETRPRHARSEHNNETAQHSNVVAFPRLGTFVPVPLQIRSRNLN